MDSLPGFLDALMSGQVAVKRIAAVEVDPESSNQHEFNAGKLRVGLGFGRVSVNGRLDATYFGGEDDSEADVSTGDYTLYDAREAHPTRTEYRLYYNTPLLTERARPGDLLVLFRAPESDDLTAVVARAGSEAERKLLDAIFVDDRPSLDSFRLTTPPVPSQELVEELVAAMAPAPAIARTYGATAHPLYEMALAAGRLPPTTTMSKAAQELVHAAHGIGMAPDLQLDYGLAAETELYYGISDELGERKLAALVAAREGFRAVAAYVSSTKQAAKSRRGTSLQNHFMAVLDAARIPYYPQCETEAGETPDFVVPGCHEYHESTFPTERLRMVACKSTAKERWRQVLNEANRIGEKYFLTLDPALSDETIRSMNGSRIRPFLPRSILERYYATRTTRAQLWTVAELVAELQAVV